MLEQSSPDVAIIHDWLTGMRGGEKCLEVFCDLFQAAPIYTLVHLSGSVSTPIESHRIITSLLQQLPKVDRWYRYLLPVMPFAINWSLEPYKLVFSSSHAVAKSVQPRNNSPHICYCHTPMRYAWHMKDSYFGARRSLRKLLLNSILGAIRSWDRRTACRVSHFIANSSTTQRRIRDAYRRPSMVIHPPVDTDYYQLNENVPRQDYYLVLSAFAPYKRLDLAIEACKQLNRRLLIIGSGQEKPRLQQLAGPSVEFLGWQENSVLRHHLQSCRALLFPGEEDFGIVPVEANACGTPVIAFARGGATETIIPLTENQPTGVWFDSQTIDGVKQAILDFESNEQLFDRSYIRVNALRFSKALFRAKIADFVNQVWHNRLPKDHFPVLQLPSDYQIGQTDP
ncbi:MAG: glycosyltransferase [Zavarzinella sp.]